MLNQKQFYLKCCLKLDFNVFIKDGTIITVSEKADDLKTLYSQYMQSKGGYNEVSKGNS